MVFENLTESNVAILTTPTFGDTPRAPINAISIVARPIPEPSTATLVAFAGCAFLRRSRRRHS